MKEKIAIKEIINEYNRAAKNFDGFASRHEGYAVLLEEVDELWDEIKCNSPNEKIKEEAIQVAAMGLRFLVECC